MRRDAQMALAQMPAVELERMILELGRYALSVSRRLSWRTGDAIALPRGETVESIVSLAFEKVLSGERRWDATHHPDLQKYLMDVIDSLLSHLARHTDNRVLTALPEQVSAGDIQPPPPPTAWQTQPPPDPETALLRQEEVAHADGVLQRLLEAAADDALVTSLIGAMQAGHGKARDIAAALGVPVTEIYKALKRLHRKMARLHPTVQASPDAAPQRRPA